MPDRGLLVEALPANETIWRGLNADLPKRREIIDALRAGSVAFQADNIATDPQLFEAHSDFTLQSIGAKTYLIPRRYAPMLRFFLRSPFKPKSPKEPPLLERHNTLISGGPGTGKSYQITQFISALAGQERDTPLRVAIAAPTGKAAARFASLTNKPNILIECQTIHRLLQMSPDGGRAKYHALNPLPIDVLVIDEISMVDLGLFARLIAALADHAQILLAGDTGQLPAVDGMPIDEALTFLCSRGLLAHLHLTQTHRFSAAKAATYAALQRDGLQAIEAGAAGMQIRELHGIRDLYDFADKYAREEFCSDERRALGAKLSSTNLTPDEWNMTAREALRQIGRSVILCETNEGNSGTRALNDHISRVVASEIGTQSLHLTPIMITANSYDLQLFNGDTGCIISDGVSEYAVIESGVSIKKIPLGRLRNWQVAYAITVHKSQGSEYEMVYFIKGSNTERDLDHRLIYTAVTRAKESAVILKLI
jgi:exodeoxyribonuclease V alpha subunit